MKKIILFAILSLVATGCINQKSTNENQMSENKDTSPKIITEKQTAEDKNQNREQITPTSSAENIQGTENWRVYEKKDQNVRIKYHKNWYYDRDEELEKKLGYDLYIGFAESPEILAQGSPYPIEFFIISNDIKFSYVGYFKEITKKGDKKYILACQNKYKDILDKMAETFEFLDE